eukprot:symbB.v1.2.006822.t1/scaffold379.1/size332124/4
MITGLAVAEATEKDAGYRKEQDQHKVGEVVAVRKHSSMGCAVVSMTETRVRQAIVTEGNECTINGLKVQIKPHHNKETQEEVLTDLFVAWGRQVEKVNPLSEQMIAKYFDVKYKEIVAGWKAAEEGRRQAEELEQRAQEGMTSKLEQQRQELVLKRSEERRRYEVRGRGSSPGAQEATYQVWVAKRRGGNGKGKGNWKRLVYRCDQSRCSKIWSTPGVTVVFGDVNTTEP